MAKKSKIARNLQRIALRDKYADKRLVYKRIIKFSTWYDLSEVPSGSVEALSASDVLRMSGVSSDGMRAHVEAFLRKSEAYMKESFDLGDNSLPVVFSFEGRSYVLAPVKEKVVAALHLLPKDSSRVRVRNRCSITGRPRGYHRYFGISRNLLRSMALEGLLPGVKKDSW